MVSPPQSWAEVWALTPHVVYSWVQQTPLAWQPEDTPSGALRVELTIHNVADNVVSGSKSATLAYIDGEATLIRYVGEEMDTDASNGHWAKLATATPPQEFDLPLAEGFSAAQPCTYWKNQFGAVTIGGTAEKSNGVADLTTIATLPESFRPAKNVERPTTLSGGGSRYAGSVLIGSNGSVRIHTPTTANVVTFAATFLAAD